MILYLGGSSAEVISFEGYLGLHCPDVMYSVGKPRQRA